MTQQEFDRLLDKYFAGTATPQERGIVDAFYAKLQAGKSVNALSDTEREALKEEMFTNIKRRQFQTYTRKHNVVGLYTKIAATLLMVLSVAYALIHFTKVPKEEVAYLTKSTARGQRASITLSDGTIVTLNAGSSIRYPEHFSDTLRQVRLVGEAFFDVHHEEERSFQVYSEGLITSVLGTSFNIHAFPGEDVAVTVSTGKVKVNPEIYRKTNRTVAEYLIPNQQATFHPDDLTMTVHQVDPDVYLAWKSDVLNFKMVPFEKVVHTLERWYNVDITLVNDAANKCLVRAIYRHENLENVLNGLQLLVDFQYEFTDRNKVKITGKKCVN